MDNGVAQYWITYAPILSLNHYAVLSWPLRYAGVRGGMFLRSKAFSAMQESGQVEHQYSHGCGRNRRLLRLHSLRRRKYSAGWPTELIDWNRWLGSESQTSLVHFSFFIIPSFHVNQVTETYTQYNLDIHVYIAGLVILLLPLGSIKNPTSLT